MSAPSPQESASAGATEARFSSLPLITITLILINLAVYIVQALRGGSWIDPTPDQLMAAGGNVAMLTLTGDAWRLLTSVFVHGGPVHLLMNMYMLFLIGMWAERKFGRLGFLMLFLAGGVMASCASTWWQSSHTLGTDMLGRPFVRLTVSVGASGAIMAILGALLSSHFIRSTFAQAHEMAEAGLGKSLVQVIAINVGMGFLIPGVDNSAHVGGVVAGLLMGALIQFAAELTSSLPVLVARLAVPPLLAAACGWVLLHGSDWSDMHELRTLQEEQQQSERKAAEAEAEVAAREIATEQERQSVPPPVTEAQARGQVVKFGESGTSFALSGDGKMAYAVDHYKNQVSVIDLARGTVEKTIAGPRVPIKGGCQDIFCGDPAAADIAVLRGKPIALVSSMLKDSVVFIDVQTGEQVKAVRVGKTPHTIFLADDDKRAYVHNVGDNSISVIDVDSASAIHTFRLPKLPPEAHVNPGRRLPMWMGSEGTSLHVQSLDGYQPRVTTFDVKAMAELKSESAPYGYWQVAAPFGDSNEMLSITRTGLHFMDKSGAYDSGTWEFCLRLDGAQFATTPITRKSGRVAVADHRGHGGDQSTIYVANPNSYITLGHYPISGVVMKLLMSDDGQRVYAVNNLGEFAIIDTRQRMDPGATGDLFCKG